MLLSHKIIYALMKLGQECLYLGLILQFCLLLYQVFADWGLTPKNKSSWCSEYRESNPGYRRERPIKSVFHQILLNFSTIKISLMALKAV